LVVISFPPSPFPSPSLSLSLSVTRTHTPEGSQLPCCPVDYMAKIVNSCVNVEGAERKNAPASA
jgi:hypothetical protein